MLSWFIGKSFEDQVEEFEEKINTITTSLIKSSEEKLPEGQYDLASLLNPDVCNQYTIFLGSELDKRFKKVEIESINSAIFIGKRKKVSQKNNNNNSSIDNMDVDNYSNTKESKYTKKNLCNKIASHYIRTFNIISSILTAIDPEKNMCSRRIKALYDTTNFESENKDKTPDSGYVKICKSDDIDNMNMLYPDNINDIPGIKYLLKLYYFYLIQDENIVNLSEKEKIEKEFVKLNEALNTIYISSDIKSLDPIIKTVEETLNRSITNLEKINTTTNKNKKQNSTDIMLQQLTELVSQLKSQINTIKIEKNKNNKTNIEESLKKISNDISLKLNIFEGSIESKVKLLEDKINSTIKDKLVEESKNIVKQNIKENKLNNELKKVIPKIPSSRNNLNNESLNNESLNNESLNNESLNNEYENESLNNENENEVLNNENENESLNNEKENEVLNNENENEVLKPTKKYNLPLKPIPPKFGINYSKLPYKPSQPSQPSQQYKSIPTYGGSNSSNNKKKNMMEVGDIMNDEESGMSGEEDDMSDEEDDMSDEESGMSDGESDTSDGESDMSGEEESDMSGEEEESDMSGEEEDGDMNGEEEDGDMNGEEEDDNMSDEEMVEEDDDNMRVINEDNKNNEKYKSIVDKFIDFVNKYNKDYLIKDEYKINLRPKTIQELSNFKCTSEPSNVIIKINDSKFSEFKSIYQKMKNHYINSTNNLMSILENSLIEQSKDVNDIKFKLKSITNNELNLIQLKVMHELTSYYTKCQEYYESAFIALSKALETE